MDTSRASPGSVLSRLLLGNRVQQAVHVAAKLGIADQLVDGPRTAHELAPLVGAHPDALFRLLRVLASYDVFVEDADGRFGLNPVAELLRTGTRESKRAFALWSGHPSYELFGSLEHSVRTGKPAFDELFGMEFFAYLEQKPEVGELFDEFMSRQTAPMGAVVAGGDFAGVHTVVDVGGGRGELLCAILNAHEHVRGVLLDARRAVESAGPVLDAAGVLARCSTVVGDYLRGVPRGGDLYVLKNIVHGLDDEQAVQVLSRCRDAMAEHGRVWMVEFVIAPGNAPSPGKLMDLLMLVGSHGGRERTEAEFGDLLAAAGLRLTAVRTTRYGYGVVEGSAAVS